MKCNQAAEFVSALCDGEKIPSDAAVHLGECQICHDRLNDYLQIGAELKLLANVTRASAAPEVVWGEQRPPIYSWWQIGRETMRIPKFAFALLLATVIALGSTLTMVKVRAAHTQGRVLVLNVKTPDGEVQCALDIEGTKHQQCENVFGGTVTGLYGFRFVSREGDRIQLGVRATRGPGLKADSREIAKLAEAHYWFEPGETLNIDVSGGGSFAISGQESDYLPWDFISAKGAKLDPDPGELRIFAPLLLRGNTVLCDFGEGSVAGSGGNTGIELSVPHDGRYEISLAPLQDAVEGHINGSRIAFELKGLPYQLLTGAPIARADRVWILYLHDSQEKGRDESYRGMSEFLAKTPAQ